MNFINVYDAQAAGNIATSAYGGLRLSILGIVAGVGIIILGVMIYRRYPFNTRIFSFPAAAVIGSVWFSIFYLDQIGADKTLRAGNLPLAKGCINFFETNHGEPHAERNSSSDESWFLAGNEFAYKAFSNRQGYHQIEERGGVIHAGQYLRVAYLVTPILHRKEIMKIDVGGEHCPISVD